MKITIEIKNDLHKGILIKLLEREDLSKRIISLLEKNIDYQNYTNWRGDRVYSITIDK